MLARSNADVLNYTDIPCAPNCADSGDEDFIIWYATKDIHKHEEITKTYVQSVDFGFCTCQERLSEIKRTWRGNDKWDQCRCSICGSSEENRGLSDHRRKQMKVMKNLVTSDTSTQLSPNRKYELMRQIISSAIEERVPDHVLRWWSVASFSSLIQHFRKRLLTSARQLC